MGVDKEGLSNSSTKTFKRQFSQKWVYKFINLQSRMTFPLLCNCSVWYTILYIWASAFIQCKKHNFKFYYIRPNPAGRSHISRTLLLWYYVKCCLFYMGMLLHLKVIKTLSFECPHNFSNCILLLLCRLLTCSKVICCHLIAVLFHIVFDGCVAVVRAPLGMRS